MSANHVVCQPVAPTPEARGCRPFSGGIEKHDWFDEPLTAAPRRAAPPRTRWTRRKTSRSGSGGAAGSSRSRPRSAAILDRRRPDGWGYCTRRTKKPPYATPTHTVAAQRRHRRRRHGPDPRRHVRRLPVPGVQVARGVGRRRCSTKLVAANTITLVYHPMSTLDAKTNDAVLDPGRLVGRAARPTTATSCRTSDCFSPTSPPRAAGAGLTDDQTRAGRRRGRHDRSALRRSASGPANTTRGSRT